jgi:hypothetical protein
MGEGVSRFIVAKASSGAYQLLKIFIGDIGSGILTREAKWL